MSQWIRACISESPGRQGPLKPSAKTHADYEASFIQFILMKEGNTYTSYHHWQGSTLC